MEAAGVEWRARGGRARLPGPGPLGLDLCRRRAELGWLGELHPLVLREWELDGPVAAFELDVDALLELARRRIAPTAT